MNPTMYGFQWLAWFWVFWPLNQENLGLSSYWRQHSG
jgi:hypothetical protein